MWRLDNHTAYAAERAWWRDADGAEVWTVAVKATYELLPDGRSRVAAWQQPVHTGLVLHEDGMSPAFETDLGPPKHNTDVWLCGHAYSRNGQAVERMRVGFEVGSVRRYLDVYGDRYWQFGLLRETPSVPTPFVRMPLTWANAYGGDGPQGATGNPVGKGLEKDARGLRPLPNLEHPMRHVENLLVRSPAMGVGPVPRDWPARAQYAGTYDAAWQATRAPLQAADLDPRHWQVAVPEQQVAGHLKGGEPIVLDGLTPPGFAREGIYRTRVPRLSLGFTTHFSDGSRATSRSAIHSLILLPDGADGSGPLISVVHHMALPCHPKVNRLHRTVIIEKQRPLERGQEAQA